MMKFDTEFWDDLDQKIPGWMSKNEAEFLVENVKGDNYMEIGVAFGKSLRLMHHHFPKMFLYGIDLINHGVHTEYEDVDNVFIDYANAAEMADEDVMRDNSTSVYIQKIDTLFIDGDHTYRGALLDFVSWYNKVKPGGRIIFHDYGRDKAHEGVTKTVDAIKSLLEDHATVRAIWAGTKPS